ncbi:MAG: hypothetical protein ACPHID_07905 [Thermoplasmatota archaeon]
MVEKPGALVLVLLTVLFGPVLVLLVPSILVGSGTMEETFNFQTGERSVSGFFPAFFDAYGAAFTVWPIALLYLACILGALLRWRAPLGGGNAAGTVVLASAAGAFTVQSAFVAPGDGAEAFGAGLFGFFLSLFGAVAVALLLATWGRQIATQEQHAARAAKRDEAQNAYLD